MTDSSDTTDNGINDEKGDLYPEVAKLINDNIDDLFWKDDVAAQSKESK